MQGFTFFQELSDTKYKDGQLSLVNYVHLYSLLIKHLPGQNKIIK